MTDRMIGIVGGVGSYAGIDLIRKIYDQTDTTNDQEHLPVAMVSTPHKVVDRTRFLLGYTDTNPGFAIAGIIEKLVSSGAEIIGIPCNTAHAEPIFQAITSNIPSTCKLIHLIEEVGTYLNKKHPNITEIGVLGTSGTVSAGVYPDVLRRYDIEVIHPSDDIQSLLVHPAIYDESYGIKAVSNPVSAKARTDLMTAATSLSRKQVQAIVLGCTEIPLALTEERIEASLVIDATSILASALIREARRGATHR